MGATKVLAWDPCPCGQSIILAVAHMENMGSLVPPVKEIHEGIHRRSLCEGSSLGSMHFFLYEASSFLRHSM